MRRPSCFFFVLINVAYGVLDCYPNIKNKPNVSRELCEAQGCKWNSSEPPFCRFKKPKALELKCQKVEKTGRIPCRNPRYNNPTPSFDDCIEMGCCFQDNTCFQPWTSGYELKNLTEQPFGWTGRLHLNEPGPFGNDIDELELNVWLETNERVRIFILDPSHPRFRVENLVNSFEPTAKVQNASLLYDFGYTTQPFGFSITRRSTGHVLFNSTPSSFNGLVFENQFLQLSTSLVSQRIYGLGEHVTPLKLPTEGGQHYTFFARDEAAFAAAHQQKGGRNIYGVHPFYLSLEPEATAHGVFFLNSNAMEVVLDPESLTFRSIGGIVDVFLFLGPSPADVVKQYTQLVGRPNMPAYWALGYHLCRWGYTLNTTRDDVEHMRKYRIPQDAQWNDIDYMDQKAIFTLDPATFPVAKTQAFVADLHRHGQYYVNIHDPGVSSEYKGSYNFTAFDRANQLGVFIKDRHGQSPLIGKVWPGWVLYPDFFHPNAQEFWYEEIKKFHNVIPFDGMWIDMNEPSNFCDGERPFSCPSDITPDLSSEFTRTADIAYPFDPFRQPYVPGEFQQQYGGKGDLDQKTVGMYGVQYNSLHYNLHSMYGLSELQQTMKALTRVRKKRSLVVSRSTFPGSGKYGAHWLGDNNSSWVNLRDSIPGILAMNMFGISLVGPDICGFSGNTTPELCVRWHQLGAFYPFSRNHNSISSSPQAPVNFDAETRNLIRQSILHRYRLLPYLYTLFYHAHQDGSTVARALFFEFPQDNQTSDLDQQFLLGRGLLITPVLYSGAVSVKGYFPKDCWFDYWTGKQIENGHIELPAPLNHVNLHVRGGFILPRQLEGMTTRETRKNPFDLIVAVGSDGKANGDLYLDDGESLNINSSYYHIQYHLTYVDGVFDLVSQVSGPGYKTDFPKLKEIRVYGVENWTNDSIKSNEIVINTSYVNGVLYLSELNLSMDRNFQLKTTRSHHNYWILIVLLVLSGVVLFNYIHRRKKKTNDGYKAIINQN